MKIEFAAREFYEHSLYFRGYSKDTIKRYRQAIRFFCQYSKITLIEEITNEKLRALFFYGRTERNWKPITFLSYHKSLAVFLRWCKEKGYCNDHSIDKIELPKLEHKLPPKLTKQEAFRLLEVVYNYPYQNKFTQSRNHAIFSTFVFSGIRKRELLNLRYTDVDIENLSLFVHQGKGAKDRVIPICQALAKSLYEYIEQRKKMNKTCSEFFTSQQRNAGLSETMLKRLIIQIRKTTGIYFYIHKLRHTFATLMLEGGCDIYSLSRMMGHTNIKTTTIYLYASAEHLRAQMVKHPLNKL